MSIADLLSIHLLIGLGVFLIHFLWVEDYVPIPTYLWPIIVALWPYLLLRDLIWFVDRTVWKIKVKFGLWTNTEKARFARALNEIDPELVEAYLSRREK